MLKVMVAASGRGSNFRAILESSSHKKDYEVVGLFTNKKKAGALEIAAEHDIATRSVSHRKFVERRDHESHIVEFFKEKNAELLVLAGYMRVLSPWIIESLGENTIINIHPSLLPAFKGSISGIKDAFDYGCKITGVTVHRVSVEVDGGQVLDQEALRIEKDDSEESLAEKIHKLEHLIYPRAISLLAKKEEF